MGRPLCSLSARSLQNLLREILRFPAERLCLQQIQPDHRQASEWWVWESVFLWALELASRLVWQSVFRLVSR